MIALALVSLALGFVFGAAIGYWSDKSDLEAELREQIKFEMDLKERKRNDYISAWLSELNMRKDQLALYIGLLAHLKTVTDRDVSAECEKAESWKAYITERIEALECVMRELKALGFINDDTTI